MTNTLFKFRITKRIETDFFDVDQLPNVHVVITAADVRTHRLHDLPHNRYDDISPGQRERLAVEQLLQQRHHVAVIGRAA